MTKEDIAFNVDLAVWLDRRDRLRESRSRSSNSPAPMEGNEFRKKGLWYSVLTDI
jgi:hypothetical protein